MNLGFVLKKLIKVDLDMFIDNLFKLAHLAKSSIACCNRTTSFGSRIVLHIFVSSAYIKISSEVMDEGRSLQYNR